LQELCNTVKDGLILEALHFGSLGLRYSEVLNPHEGTFEWIFTNPALVFDKEPALAIDFPAWLERGSGIFHVGGKPGSGKSVLMKYLWQHDSTSTILAKWAGDKQLLVAKFFFWRIGITQDQKSLKGLVRSLLFEVLCARPAMTRRLFPLAWERVSPELYRRGAFHLTTEDIFAAFDRLIGICGEEDDDYADFRICFFVDGLDEFDDSGLNETHGRLVERLQRWTERSRGNIKMCVSSRLQPPFIDRFSAAQRITLNNLTDFDIRHMVNGRLEQHERFRVLKQRDDNGCTELVTQVTSAAEGVFLWVALLLNSLSKGLDKGDTIKMLRRRVSETPTELEPFLAQIMDGIERPYRQGANLLLATVLRLTGVLLDPRNQLPGWDFYDEIPPPANDLPETSYMALLPAFALLQLSDDSRLLKSDFELVDLEIFASVNSEVDITERETLAAAVMARCNGLLEIISDMHYVKFMHRSIPEFLCSYFGTHAAEHQLDDFQVTLAIAWAYQVEAKVVEVLMRADESPSTLQADRLLAPKFNCSRSCYIPPDSDDRLHLFLGAIRQVSLENCKNPDAIFQLLLAIESTATATYKDHQPLGGRYIKSVDICRYQRWEVINHCAELGFFEFIDWILRRTAILQDSERFWNAASGAVAMNYFTGDRTYRMKTKLVLFEHGLTGQLACPPSFPGGHEIPLWYILLSYMATFLEQAEFDEMEEWLRRGADPDVTFHLARVWASTDCVRVASSKDKSIGVDFRELDECDGRSVPEALARTGQTSITLRQVVTTMRPRNERELLRLIDGDSLAGHKPSAEMEVSVGDMEESQSLGVQQAAEEPKASNEPSSYPFKAKSWPVRMSFLLSLGA
jgi:hypothetical protein